MKRFQGKEAEIVLSNTLGQVLLYRHLDEVEHPLFQIDLDRSVFKDGLYLISVVHKGHATTKRLLSSGY